MSSLIPTYIPSPNWDIPIDSDIVVLGRLIKDPKDPQSKIPKSRDVPSPPPKIYEGEKTDWQTTLDRLHSGSIGIWAKCLQVIRGELRFNQLKSSMEEHKFKILETKYFLPDDEYLALALDDEGVGAYLEVYNWRKPVYLITGIKIAKGARAEGMRSSQRSVQAEVKVDATSGGVPVEAGPEANWESKKRSGIRYGGSTDYIFAYQLKRMKPKRRGKDFSNNTYVKGAVFGMEDGCDDSELKVRDMDIEDEVNDGFLDTWEQIEQIEQIEHDEF